ncbi:MAG: outer membrane beta-barrel protein [Verrucomicrobiota bacterium]|nr:outer membrane beta-barrel protein [Verrucomicrobiota bacterium]
MNKWTMALAAAGVVSLSSVAQAQEAAAGANALAASTTLSGYVSTSYTMVDGSSNSNTFRSGDDNDRFAVDVVDLKFASAQGAGEYATGYTVELWAGPAAGDIGTEDATNAGTVELMQANIDLRLPVGNGLDIKLGQWGTTVGAETYNYNANAFYSRSYGFQVEPTHHTGILASYQLSDDLGVAVGVANDTTDAGINDRGSSGSAYIFGANYTLPDSTGFAGGTTITYGGVIDAGADATDKNNHYFGVSVPLPVEGLSYNLAWDIVENNGNADDNVVGHYLSYALNDKATVNVRYEHGNINSNIDGSSGNENLDGLESITVGLDYALWENVTSRIEFRTDDWDGKTTSADESMTVNIIYSF